MDFLTSLLWLSLNIFHEARSEDQFSQVAVGLATVNRARNRNQTIKETVLEPHAFSWVSQKESYFPDDAKAFSESVKSAIITMKAHNFIGRKTDHYHHVSVKPYWANKMSYIGTFGSHKFYKPLVKIKAARKVKHENLFIVQRGSGLSGRGRSMR